MAEALPVKIGNLQMGGHHPPNFRIEGDVPANHLGQWMPYNFAPTVFTQRNFVADFLQAKCDLTWKTTILGFWAPLRGGLGAMYDNHLRFTGKRVVSELPISANWTFFARCYDWGTTSEYRFNICDFTPMGAGWPKIWGRRGRPHQPFFFSEN